MRPAPWGCALGALLVAFVARADTCPSRWDEVRDPELADAWRLHVYARSLLDQRDPHERQSFARKVRIALEAEHAESSRFPFLRFDLGAACAQLEDDGCVIRVLEPAIQLAPDSPSLFEGYDELAHAYAVYDRSKDERRICELYLPRVTEDRMRAILLLNCAEAAMHLGQLDVAIAQYKDAIDVAAGIPNVLALEDQTEPLSVWGMAVALDRRQEPYEAGQEIKLALSLDPMMQLIQHGQQVFFSPERERYWYVALGFQRYAQTADGAEAAATLWQRAEGCWREYIDDVSAHAAADRWVDLARAHLVSAHAARVAAERGAKRRMPDVERSCVD